jgi:Redoxin
MTPVKHSTAIETGRARRSFFPLALLGVLVACSATARPSASSPLLGRPVTLSLPTNAGAIVQVPGPGDRSTVLDFFGPTCRPCKDRVPALVARRERLARSGARLVLVAVLSDGETTEDAERALAVWGVKLPFLVDHGGAAERDAGVDNIPETLVFDSRGDLRWVGTGDANADDVVAAVEALH